MSGWLERRHEEGRCIGLGVTLVRNVLDAPTGMSCGCAPCIRARPHSRWIRSESLTLFCICCIASSSSLMLSRTLRSAFSSLHFPSRFLSRPAAASIPIPSLAYFNHRAMFSIASIAASAAAAPGKKLELHYAGSMNAPAGIDLPAGVQYAAAADRNKADIAEALKAHLHESVTAQRE